MTDQIIEKKTKDKIEIEISFEWVGVKIDFTKLDLDLQTVLSNCLHSQKRRNFIFIESYKDVKQKRTNTKNITEEICSSDSHIYKYRDI